MKKNKESGDSAFFVEVKNPLEVRKYVLETLKQIIEVLQRFERFKAMRHQKIEEVNNLRKLMRESNKLLGILKAKLPKTNIKATPLKEGNHKSKKQKEERPKKIGKKEEKAARKEPTKIDELESQLSAIEEKLRGLT